MGRPTLIIVGGPPGSGKTTLAHRLAAAVGCPALCRDEIKEGMVRNSPGFVPAHNDPLTLRTYEVFFAAIELLLRAEVTLVAEAAFQHELWWRGLEPLQVLGQFRLVRCCVEPEVAHDRMLRRSREQNTRTAHADAAHLEDPATAAFVPVALHGPTLDVETSTDYRPGLDEIAAFCAS